MARRSEQHISGAVGNVIFYKLNGQDLIRSKPGKMKRKRSTPVARLNTAFGSISTYGSRMLKQVSTCFLFAFTLDVYNRVRGWMHIQFGAQRDTGSWQLAQQTSMCPLNKEADLRDLLMTEITINDIGEGKININIAAMNPKQSLRAPQRTSNVNMKFIAVTSAFKEDGLQNSFCMEQYKFAYRDTSLPEKTLLLDTKAAGNIAIVVIALEYETASGIYNTEKRWLPAAVVAMGRMKG